MPPIVPRCASLLAFSCLWLTSVAVSEAATITYAQRFHLVTHDVFPAFPGYPRGLGLSPREHHELSNFPPFEWTVPAFDSSLGAPVDLSLELEGRAVVTGRVEFGEVFVAYDLYDPLDFEDRFATAGASALCPSPCKFRGSVPLSWGTFVDPLGPSPTLFLFYSPDKFGTWEVAAAGEVQVAAVGTLRATYTYEPGVAPIPEPTSVALLSTGLVLLAARLRAGHSSCGERS